MTSGVLTAVNIKIIVFWNIIYVVWKILLSQSSGSTTTISPPLATGCNIQIFAYSGTVACSVFHDSSELLKLSKVSSIL
jgi:hypothetical protein